MYKRLPVFINFFKKQRSPLDVSLALSEDSSITLTELTDRDQTPTFNSNLKATPVLRRRRSHMNMRRNYRIIDPDESRLILQQQSADLEDKKGKILRRKSSRKAIGSQPPLIITPPVLLNRTQGCSICCKERQDPITHEMPPSPLTPIPTSADRIIDEETARLSFVSSSTGYSSARSSLRSSDGNDDHSANSPANRDSGISSQCSLSSQSTARRSALLSKGSLTQLDRIAIELLDTERAYVEDLNAVIKGYMDFLVENRERLHVTLDAISSLFGCIERIFAFNKRLFQELDVADLDCVKMSKCFVDNSGRFEDYISYCTNYHRMMSTLYGMQQQPAVARALSERQSALGHSLPLSAFLLKPVQRILKYHLFLENILKNLPPSTSPEEMVVVKKAHETMTTQASRINEEKKKAEHTERVTQLQTALQKWRVDEQIQTSNLSAYGDLLLEASFRQAGSKTSRLLFLFEEMLLIVKQRGSSYVCKDYIMCSNLMLNEWICPEEPLSFQVLSFDNPRAQYVFLASSMDQKRVWMTELKRMMLDHYSIEIPEKTKKLMLSMDHTKMIPFGRPEFAEVSMKNHKKVPKYLEKRRKSVDQNAENTRRRSLSASRLLGGSKTSLSSEATREPTVAEPPRCTCHMAGGIYNGVAPSTSTAPPTGTIRPSLTLTSQTPAEMLYYRTPVSRTLSAAAIDLDQVSLSLGEVPAGGPTAPNNNVLTSRSRYQQARNRRLPPRHGQETQQRSVSGQRLAEDEIDKTFDQLYAELVSYGEGKISPVLHNGNGAGNLEKSHPTCNNNVSMASLVVPECAVNRLRSKSLTRLDEYEVEPVCLRPNIERRFSKIDQVKRKSRKYHVNQEPEAADVLRSTGGRLSLTDHEIVIHGDADGLPPRPNTVTARQRTPLTLQQAAQLDELLPNNMSNACGLASASVLSIIRHYENA
ncbi:unnamed protein product [Caenorhabditis auriculariae]|uniref:DH domain-containing protein n=1 Tax=Caenorhabditis auriculariae TaxID=2777116 RepID=A0A8S1GV68_9PELO|nr:unnamed protein product [Caenorhabditis auriculariae]